MKYVVNCSYCNNTYTVNVKGPETGFICSTCGASNGVENVIERIPLWKGMVKGNQKEAVTDTDISGIKSFEIKDYQVKSDWKQSLKKVWKDYAAAWKKKFWFLGSKEENDHWYPEMKHGDED